MRKRQKEAAAVYEAMWDEGRGSHHPDFDPGALHAYEPGFHVFLGSLSDLIGVSQNVALDLDLYAAPCPLF